MSKITKIEAAKRNKDRVNIYIDGEYAFSCFGEIVYKLNLARNMEVDTEKLKEIVFEDEFLRCKNSSLKIIERNFKTEKEIYGKLSEKGYQEKTIERTLEFLMEYNLINDEKYSEAFIKDKIKNQGRKKIKYNLLRKGINEDTIEEKLLEINDEAEEAACRKLAEKKIKSLIKGESDNFKISSKLIRFLLSKGYEYEMSLKITKELLKINIYD